MAGSPPVQWLSAGMDSVPESADWLSPQEAEWAAGMAHAKRRLEFTLARWCAKSAIAALEGVSAGANIEIGHLPEGAPAAFVEGEPFPRRISMTDRADWAVCAVAPPGVEVGCDLELVEPRSEAFVGGYFTDYEQELVNTSGGVDPLAANLIWSAKEAALKVLRTGLRRDTRSVEVRPSLVGETAWLPLEIRAAEGTVFPGWWRRFNDFILSIAADGSTAAPVALDDPIALAGAEPSHRWMSGMSD